MQSAIEMLQKSFHHTSSPRSALRVNTIINTSLLEEDAWCYSLAFIVLNIGK